MRQSVSEENWPEITRRVHKDMAAHVRGFLASISWTDDNESGRAHGSGAYLEISARHYLMTAEHVVRTGYQTGRITHLPRTDGPYHAFPNPWFYEPDPVDLALTAIDSEVWSAGDRLALSTSRIARAHDVAPDELLMLCGYPEGASYFSRFTGEGVLDSRLIPYTARETALPDGVDPAYYFALQYERDKAQPADPGKDKLPKPHGFSGSPIWDSGFAASGCAADWTPERARIIGVALRWQEQNSCIVAVRAEHVRAFLLDNVRKDVAHRHWIGGGGPADDAEDLDYAVQLVKELE